MNIIKYLYQRSRWIFLLASLAGLINGLSGAALAVVISKGVAGAAQLPLLAVAFFGLCLVQLATKSWSEIWLLKLTQGAICQLRVDLSKKLLLTPYLKLQRIGKSGLVVILTRDVDTFVQGLQAFPVAFGNVIILLSCLGYVGWVSWKIFLVVAVVFAVCLVGFQLAERGPLRQLVRIREKMETVYQHVRNLIEGSKELQLNAQRGDMFVEDVIEPAVLDARDTYVRGISGYIWVLNVGNILFYVVIGALLFLIPIWWPQRVEVLASVTMVLLFLVRPVSDLMQVLPTVRQGMIALQRINQLDAELTATPAVPPVASGVFHTAGGCNIELRNVQHAYSTSEDDHFTLGPVSLEIKAGEILFIIGGNGSGKTTLAMMILGFYQPDQGAVLLNGVVVTPGNIDAYRRHFSAVFADFHLFEELLTNDADLTARAHRYLELLGMSHKVTVVDGRFSTTNLSTGQRKRLALVVSYLEDKPVYLFDEWASDQDPAFKKVFYTELLPDLKRRGKTVVIITHDDAYFENADRIIKLQDGGLNLTKRTHAPLLQTVREAAVSDTAAQRPANLTAYLNGRKT